MATRTTKSPKRQISKIKSSAKKAGERVVELAENAVNTLRGKVKAKAQRGEAALKAAKVGYQMYQYEGTQHGFHNNSTPRYTEAAANLAWERTLAFFKQHLA